MSREMAIHIQTYTRRRQWITTRLPLFFPQQAINFRVHLNLLAHSLTRLLAPPRLYTDCQGKSIAHTIVEFSRWTFVFHSFNACVFACEQNWWQCTICVMRDVTLFSNYICYHFVVIASSSNLLLAAAGKNFSLSLYSIWLYSTFHSQVWCEETYTSFSPFFVLCSCSCSLSALTFIKKRFVFSFTRIKC